MITILDKSFTYDELQEKFNLPPNCTIDGPNAWANDSAELINLMHFRHFLSQFPLDGFGPGSYSRLSTIEELVTEPSNLFNPDVINKQSLLACGFGPTQSTNFIVELNKYKSGIHLRRIIRSFSVNGCGPGTAKEFAKKLSNIPYSFDSKTGDVIRSLEALTDDIIRRCKTIEEYGYTILYEKEEVVKASTMKFVLTGSPKDYGFKTKDEFKKSIPHWSETPKLQDAHMLITDDVNSSSSKTKSANKLGIRICTYEDALVLYNTDNN